MKKVFIKILLSLFFLLELGGIVNAHVFLLNVEYDECNLSNVDEMLWYSIPTKMGMEYNDLEINYYLYSHIPEDKNIIYFYINETAEDDPSYTWTSDTTYEDSINIKNSYVESMMMWNDVQYYSYDTVSGNKIIYNIVNLIQTSDKNIADIVIYPIDTNEYIANTKMNEDYVVNIIEESLENENEELNYSHQHCSKWKMYVDVKSFKTPEPFNKDKYLNVLTNRRRTGAHEVGHILGLGDLDRECYNESLTGNLHHNQELMGYDTPKKEYITYKDIAGVSITRGFHTDNDHIWMKRTNNDFTDDLICALCNGVIFDVELDDNGNYDGKPVNIYQECCHYNSNISSTNMLLVATNGMRDFFKCLNCRHIEEVSTNIDLELTDLNNNLVIEGNLASGEEKYYKINQQIDRAYEYLLNSTSEISLEILDKNLNKLDLNVITYNMSSINFSKYLNSGIYYIKLSNNQTDSINYEIKILEHSHIFTYIPNPINNLEHNTICNDCGYENSNSHVNKNHYCIYCNAYISDHDYGVPYYWINNLKHSATCCCGETIQQVHAVKSGTTKCLLCGGNASVGIVEINLNAQGLLFITDNGSYILPNGIIVLVEVDIDKFLNNELVFNFREVEQK